jgi:TPR repeat protein
MTFFRLLCFTSILLLDVAHANTLEQLFEQKQFDKFLPKAEVAAKQGDAQALFLLGKLYHLHLIKKPDAPDYDETEELEQAKTYYEQARAKGYARASHNLGLILIDQGQKDEGITLLKEALVRGMKVPTLQVLARAVVPEDVYWVYPQTIASYGNSGDYFAAALAAQPDQPKLENDAAGQYLRSYLYYLKARNDVQSEFDRNALRQRAISWLDKGMLRNDAIAWTNYGVLLMEEAKHDSKLDTAPDFALARVALARGAALNNPVAHFQLAEIAYEGRGLPQRDLALALEHYEAAAKLNMKEALPKANELLYQELESESNLKNLEAGIQRMLVLNKATPDNAPFLGSLPGRLAWGKLLVSEQIAPKPLPDLPLELNLCGWLSGISALSAGHSWWLVVFQQLDEPTKLEVHGTIDQKGCIRAKGKTLETLRPFLRQGAIAALAFPGHRIPLQTQVTKHLIKLDLRAPTSPQPPY